jgi:co-chaperonin GroES (HSP10)
LPESSVGKANEGEVLAVGPGLRTREDGEFIPVAVSVGDKVPHYYRMISSEIIAISGMHVLLIDLGSASRIWRVTDQSRRRGSFPVPK